MRAPSIAFFSCVALAAAIAGCGGGGGGASAPVMPGRVANGNTGVQVTIVVPQKTTSQGKRVPKFVSPSTQSAIVEIIGPIPTASPTASATLPPNLVVGAGYANFTPGSSACSTGGSGLSCTINVQAPISQAGMYAVLVITLDAPQTSNACIPAPVMGSPGPSPSPTPTPIPLCAGTVLGYNIVETNITPGTSTPVNITLGGFPAYLQPVELVSGLVGGTGNNTSGLTVFGPGTSQVSFQLLDADKNIIAGNGALQLSTTNSATINAAITATPGPTGVYTLSLTPTTANVGGQNIVTAGTSQLFVTATWPGSNALTPVSQSITLPVTVKHSVIYEARGGMVDAYLDGNNTTPAYTVDNSGFTVTTAVNPVDESLWVADYGNNDIKVYPLGLPGAAPGIQFDYCGLGTSGGACTLTNISFVNPTYVAFDANGNLFVSTYTGSAYQEQEYAPMPGATAAPSGAFTYAWTAPASIFYCHAALDNTGRLFVGDSSNQLDQFSLGMPTATVLTSANINGVGWAPDGSLWYLNWSGSVISTATKLNTFNPGTVAGSIPNLPGSPNQALAVDSLGNVYIATGQGTGVREYTASSNWVSLVGIGNSASPNFVSVFPDGLYGANHPVGVIQTSPSPVPIATPPVI